MSELREQQREACQERLSRTPTKNVFSALTDDEFRDIFLSSYFAQEHGVYTDRESLCEAVLSLIPNEAMYLTPREDELCKRMLLSPSKSAYCEWEDISAAESLVKRLWCALSIEEDRATLTLNDSVYVPLMDAMTSTQYPTAREKLFSFDATLHGLLYLSGFLYAEIPREHFIKENMSLCGNEAERLLSRYLRAGFDYTQGARGEMLLVHPGLAEPERLFNSLSGIEAPELHLTQEMMLGGMNGILPEEVASAETMRGALRGAVRPEFDEEEALEDLRMMAKQGAKYEEMREVMESMLCVLPTPWMLAALGQLHMQAVRWVGMPSAVIN